jgi:4'-phosphopantetheinyl transferase EntD
MASARDPQLRRAIQSLIAPAILIDHRIIANDDEHALLPQEHAAFATSVAKVRRASGAARIVARDLLARLGEAPQAIPKSGLGVPIWPHGVVGSLAHDSEVSVAAVARSRDLAGLGVDVEPAAELDPNVLDFVVTPNERRLIGDDRLRARMLFSVKEAVYKAIYPLDGAFLDHRDIEVSLQTDTAIVRNGRMVDFRYCMATHIVALAFVSHPARRR